MDFGGILNGIGGVFEALTKYGEWIRWFIPLAPVDEIAYIGILPLLLVWIIGVLWVHRWCLKSLPASHTLFGWGFFSFLYLAPTMAYFGFYAYMNLVVGEWVTMGMIIGR